MPIRRSQKCAGCRLHRSIVLPMIFGQRQFRADRHPVIALLPVDHDVGVAQGCNLLDRELIVLTLDLLQTQKSGLVWRRKSSTIGRRSRTELMFRW